MNKIYKVIWSRVKHCYVVVSEIAKREGKSTNTSGIARHRAAILAVATLCLVGGGALQTVEAADRYMAVYDPAALEEDMRNNRKQWGNDNDQPKPTNMDYGTFGLMSSWGRIDKRFGLITGVDTFGRQIDDGLKFRTSLGAKFYNLGFGASTFGYGSTADGSKATALGYGSYAKGADALAVGGLAKVTADQGVAIGANTIAGNQATAVGTDSKATGYASIAIGSDDGQPDAMKGGEFADRYPIETINKIFADLRKTKSDAELFDSKYALTPGVVDRRVWSPNYARGQVSIAIGARAVGYGNASTAVGALAFALGEHSTAIGVRSYVSYHAPGGMALGELSRVMAKNGLAVGNLSYSDKQGSVAYGYDAKAVGDNSIAIGHSVGANVELTQDSKNILEKVLTYRVATNPTRVSGTSLETTEDRLTYLDKLKEEWAENQNRQIGEVVGADLQRHVEYAKKQSTVMINGKQEGATNAIAIGRRAYAEGDNSMVMGSLSLGMGTNSLGIGHMTYTSGDNATAIGMEAIATAKNSMAIGVKSYANLENSIAIGVNSRTDYTKEDLEKDGWVPRGAISFPSSTQVGIVSVGSVGQERRIANVAAGYRDTDAVNVSQLRSIEDRFTNNLPNDDVANPFAYTSIEKNKGDAKDVLPLQRKDIDYRKYVHYRTKQLEIMLKERGGERIDNDFKQRIQNEVKKLADNRENAYGIQSTGLAGISDVDALLAELQKIDPKFKDKTNIEQALTVLSARKKELLKDTLKKSLSPDDLKKLGATNYLNDGAQGKDAIAIGYKALALGDDGIAIGKNSHVPQNIKGGIALGTDALANRDKGQFAYDPETGKAFANDTAAANAPGGSRAMKSSGAALSIGNGKVARQIINVAGGTEDTDAVNVAQLKRLGASVDTKVDNKLNDVLNQGFKFHFDPEWGGTPEVSVKTDNSARILIKGQHDGYNKDPRSEFVEGNIGVFGHDFDKDKKAGTKEKGLILTLKKNLTGLESIELSKDNKTVTLGSSGINMGGQKITNMADGALGTDSTDAVTGKQLYAVKKHSEDLESTVNNQLGLNVTADDGASPWVGIGTSSNQRGIIAFGVQGGESDAKKLTTKEDKNIGVIISREKNSDPHQNDDKIITQVRLAKNLTNLESIGLKKNIDGKDYTVQLKGNGIDMGQNKITNMADATLSATSNDAVTGKQLYELQQTVDGKADSGLTNITTGAKDVITGLTNVVGTGAVTVTPTTDNTTHVKTFTVNVAKDGQIADNNTGLVTGGTVKAALDSVGFNIAGDTGSQPKIAVTPSPKGVQLNIKGNTAKDAELSEGNIGVVAASAKDGNPATLTVKLAKKLADLEEIKLSKDNTTVTLSNTGIDMGNQKITNMADGALGTDSTDAVTGKQLYGLQENATNINVANWTTALGTGTIGGKNDANLVTGATVKTELDKKVDTTTYTAGMATKLDTDTYTTGMAGKANTALDNITAAGKDVITGLVDVKGAGGATVTSAVDTTGRKKTFTVTVAKDGKIADGDTGIVTGGTVKKALDDKVDTTTYTTGMAGKVDTTTYTTGMAGKVDTTTYTTGMTGKANTALDNITDAGKTVIKNLTKVVGTDGVTVTPSTDTDGAQKFTVKVAKDGKIADDDTGIVTGGTVKKALDDKVDTTTYTTGMTGKANIALDNIDDAGKTVIKNLAGEQINTTVNETYVTGKVKKGNLTSTTLDIQGAGKLVGDNLTINIKDQSITKAKLDSTLSSELDGKMASWVLKASSDANAKDEEAKKGKTIDNTNNDVIFDVATEDASKGLTVTRAGNKITYGINKGELAKAIEGDIISNINSNSTPIENISANFSISDKDNTNTKNISLTKTSHPTIQFLGEKDKIDVTVGGDAAAPTVTVTANAKLGENLDISNNKSVKDINTAITNITKTDGALSNKADKNATNIDATAKAKWIAKLGDGTIDNEATKANLVTGATVKTALDKKVDTTTYNNGMATKVDTVTYTTDMAGKANTTLSNIDDAGKDVITGLVDVTGAGGATVTSATDKDSHIKTFTVTVAKDGKIADKDTGIVTGETVYNYVHPIAEQVTQNAGDITTLKTNVTNLNNNLTAGFNLKVGEDSSAVVLNAKAAPTVEFAVEKADAGLTVSKAGNKITYGIDGSKIDLAGNTSITNINSRIDDITAQSGGDLSKKADKDAKNIDDAAKANWIAKLGGGTIDDKATNANLVTGATVKTALDGKMASWVLKASSDASEEAKKGQTIDNTNNDVIFDVATADASKGLTVTRAGNKITYGINKAELAKAIEGDIISNINSNSTPIENISANFSISDKDNTNTKNISLTKTSHPTIQFLGEKDKIDVTVGGGAAAPTVTVTANAKLGENLDISNNKSIKDINTEITNITKNGLSIPGKDGKSIAGLNGNDGIGHLGLTGAKGDDGKSPSIDMTAIKGKAGVDGKDGITRLQYVDENNNPHQVATLEDGLKFTGNNSAVNKHQLNSTVKIVGQGLVSADDATYNGKDTDTAKDKAKKAFLSDKTTQFEGTDDNIGVISNGTDTLTVSLAKNVKNLDSIGSKKVVIGDPDKGGKGKGKVTTLSTDDKGRLVLQKGTDETAPKEAILTATREEVDNGDGTKTPTDIIKLGEGPTTPNGTDGVNGTIGVNGKDGTSKVGIDGQKGVTVTGTNGKDGKDGKNGTVGINGADGITVTGHTNGEAGKNGKDGTIGINGTDGISMTGEAGKNGVSIKGEDGKTQVAGLNGKDGVGHLELAGKDGTPSIDMTAITGDTDVDGDPKKESDKITRLNYKDKAGKDHQVATLTDGMKYAGDNAKADGTNVLKKKLNNQVDIVGDIGENKTVDDFTEGNIGVFANTTDGKLHVKLAKDIKANTLTLEDSDTPQDPDKKKPITLTNKKGGLYIGTPETNDANKVVTQSELSTSSQAGQNALQTIQVKASGTDVKTLKKPTDTDTAANVLEFEAGENVQIANDGGKVKISATRDQSADKITVGVAGKDGKDGHIGVDGKDGKSGVGIDGKDGITLKGEAGEKGLSIKGEPGKPGDPAPTVAGLNGKDGIGHLGLTGAKGKDGKAPSIDMTVIAGDTDVNGDPTKDKMTRLNYVDPEQKDQDGHAINHQVATLTDGLKFTGNNLAVNAHKLNSTVKIVGQGLVSADDATYDGKGTDKDTDKNQKAFLSDKKTKFEGTNDNIGVISNGTDTLTVSLSKNVKNLDSIGSKKVVIGDPATGKVTTLSTDKKGKLVLQKGTAENAPKEAILTATREDVDNGDGTKTPTDIIKLGEGPNKQAGTDGVNGTIGVNGKDGTSKVGIDGQKGVTVTGTNGKDGKDGKNGTVGINGTDGITVTGHTNGEDGNNGKDGTIGINGTDGISMTGEAAQNGVSIKGEDGKTQVAGLNGKDGIGHLELSGKGGTPSIDMTAITGDTDVNGDPTKATDKITRLNYVDPEQKDQDGHPINHQVATLTDGMKYAGDNAKTDATKVLAKKLNSQVDIVGDIGDNKTEADFTEGNIGVFANATDGKLHVKLANAITVNTVTLQDSDNTQDPAAKKSITLTNNKGGLYIGTPAEGDANKVVTKSELKNSSEAGQNALQTIQVKAGGTDVKTLKKPTDTDTTTNVLEFEAGENVQITNDEGKVKISSKRDQTADTITVGKDGKDGKNGEIGVKGQDGKSGVGINGKNGITITGHEDPVDPKEGQPGKPGRDGIIGINGLDGISMTGEAGKNGLSIKGKDGESIAGLNGKDGIGHLGLTGAKGEDGKTPEIDMTAVAGKADVHDKKITRLNYIDPAQIDEHKKPINHQVATLDDGLKFIGNNLAVNAHKLNSTVKIVGQGLVSADDATYDGKGTDTDTDKNQKAFLSDKKTKFEGTDDNIGVISNGTDTLTVSLSKNVKNLDSIGSKKVVIGDPDKGGKGKGKVTTLSTDDEGKLVLQKGTDENAPKEAILTATREEVDNGDGTKTPTDIIKLGEGPTTPNGTDGVNGTIGVNGKDGTSKVGIDGQKGVTVTGTNGKDGKDGKNGTVGINGADGITVTGHTNGEAGKKGKDGTIGINGTDGISMTGEAAQNGVSIKGEDGKTQVAGLNGKDGIGHLELAGKGGTPSIDMTAITGDTDVDGDSTKEADKITRLNYKDKAGKDHQVATLDDGMKYAGDNANTKVLAKKLNSQVDIVGDIGATKTEADFTSANIGVFANTTDGKLHVKLAKDITGLDSVTAGKVKATNEIVVGDPDKGGKGKGKVATLTTSNDGKLMLQNADADKPREVLTVTETNNTTTIILGEAGKAGKDGKNGHIGVNGKDGKPGVGIDGKDGITLEGEAGKNGVSIKGEPGKNGEPAPTIAGLNGKDGIGHLGLTGAKGDDGKSPSIDMTAIKGKAGVDGKDGITRLQYVDENNNPHQVATLEDGLKFIGNNLAVNAHTLNSTVKIVGQGLVSADDATYNGKDTDTAEAKAKKAFLSDKKTQFEGTDDNIGVISDGTDTLTVSLSKNVKNLDSIGSKKVVIGDPDKGGKGKGKVTTLSTDDKGRLVLQKGTDETAPKEAILTATREEVDNGDGTKTPTDIIKLGEGPTTPNGTDGVNGTIGVNGKDGTSKVDIDGQKGVTVTGKNGKDGKDGKNGTVGINGTDGITVTGHTNGEDGNNGKDGTIGINGTDGISMTGEAGKNGVSIKGEDGKTQVAGLNGKDGVGHLELAGKDGTPSIDMTAITGNTDVDGDSTKEADKITRLNYKDKAGKNHQVATLDDGMKYAGDNAKADGTNVLKKKLNNQVDIVGDIKDKDVNHFISGNIGVFAYDGKLHVKLAKDITGLDSVTSGIVNATNKIVVGDPDKNGKGQGKVATLTTSDDGKLMLQNAGVDTPREVLTVTEKNNTTTIILGEAGENGKDGKNGHIGVNGKDGKPGVGIDGKDGITLEGEAGKNGLSIKGGPGKPGDPAPTIAGLNGKDGIGHLGLTGAKGDDGKTPSMDMTVIAGNTDVNGDPDNDKMTRLNYKDEAGNDHQVATLTDGLKFAGNNKTVSKQTLNSTVQIVGQGLKASDDADGEATLSDGKTKFVGTNDNIGVISDGNGKLTVALHKDVKVETVTATDGITVGKGEGAVALKGKDGKLVLEVKDKEGNTTDTKEVLTTGSSSITVGEKAEKPSAGKAGKEGQNGTIGVNGKDGSAVVLNGKDGSIGLNGENGKDGISIRGEAGKNIDGKDGKDGINGKTGIDGTDVTRIVYTEKDPDGKDKKDADGKPITHQVANLDDGMKYAGDNADTKVLAKKLNNQVDIVGDIKDKKEKDFTEGNIGVFANTDDGKLHVKLAKTLEKLDKVSTKKVVIGDPDKGNVTTLSTDDTGRLVLQKGTDEKEPKETILTATQVTDPTGKVVGDELHLGIGKDGINGKIAVDGKDGKSKVGIDGTDGITITGHTDAKDGQPAKDGTIGINGTNGITMTGKAAEAGIQIENGPVLNAKGLDMKDKGITGLGAISAKTINATDDKGNTTVSMNGKNGTLSFAGTTGADGKAIPGVTLGTNNGRLVVLDDNNKPKDTVALVSDLQDVVNKTDTAIMKIDRNVRNVGANAAAMAMLKPLQYDPLEPTQIMAAIGSYRGTQAAAIGLSHYTNESTMFNVGVSVGAGNNMMGVGVTRKFGSSADERAVPDRYKAGPISSVYVMQDEVTALKAENRQIKASYYKVLQDNEEMKAKLDALMKKLGL